MHHAAQYALIRPVHQTAHRIIVEIIVILNQQLAPGFSERLKYCEFLKIGSRGLLQEHMSARIQTVLGQTKVGSRRRGDVDHIGAYLGEHTDMIGEPCFDAETLGRSFSHRARKIAYASQLNARQC